MTASDAKHSSAHAVIHAVFALALAVALQPFAAHGERPLYRAARHSIDAGGAMRSTGGDLELSGTFGQPDAGVLTGGDLELSGGFWFAVSPTDCNEDGGVGFLDLWRLRECITGPSDAVSMACRCLDVNASGTVDLRDMAAFQREFNDPTAPPSEPGLTTVDGFVRSDDGSPVVGAVVRVHEQPGRAALTNQSGRFIILDVDTTLGLIHVKASKIVDGLLATGAVTGVPPCANGITDAGVITLAVSGNDLDGDKLPDALEPALGYDPTLADTDGNGIVDGLEDPDGDGVVNCLEVVLGTDLFDPDTDGDFLDDAQELQFRTDPINVDTDTDGIIDGEEAEFSSDPLDDLSLPAVVAQRFGHAFGLIAAAQQLSAPPPNIPLRAVFAPAPIALENVAAPPPLNLPAIEAFGPLVSVDNQEVP